MNIISNLTENIIVVTVFPWLLRINSSRLLHVLGGLRVILEDDCDEHVDDGDGGHDEVRHHERVGHEHAVGREREYQTMIFLDSKFQTKIY